MKKSLALILALIMVLCMLPSVAFAALDTGHSIPVSFTVLYVSEKFNIGYSYGSSEKTTFVCQYSEPHSDTASTNHAIAISDIKAAADRATVNSGYKIVGWTKEASANPKIWGFNLAEPTACNKDTTIYLVAKDPNPKPGKPSDSDILPIVGDNAVKVHCTNVEAGHEEKTYALIADSFNIGDVTMDNASGKYFCNITVHAGKYVDKYNNTYGSHTLDKNEGTAVIKLEYNNGKWEKVTQPPVVFNVKCENQTPEEPQPPKPENTPAIPGLTELNEVVKVKCNTAPESHKEKTFGFNWFSCQVGEVIANADDEYFCTITVLPNGYVASYNLVYPGHTLDPEGQKETLSLKWNATAKQWENTESNKLPITFTVKCDTVEPTEPPKPNATDIPRIVGNGAVKVHCNANTEHKDEIYGLLEDSFDIGDVTKDEVSGEYTCTITVQPDKYVAAYNGVYAGHTLAPADQTGKITLKWQLNDGEDGTGKWTVGSGVPVVFKVVCETGVTDKVTVSFNSNGGTAVDPQTIEKGGKATRPANPTMDGYTFVNWYLDGKVYDFNTPVTEDITLHAQWKKNDDNPGQNPYPDPSPKPNPGGHDHGNSTVVVPITVYMPPKTGDMPFWYSIAQFLGLVK